jgi:hypothetical protein
LGLVCPLSSSVCILELTGRYYYEKKFDECRGVIQPEMALPMGIPGAFGLPVCPLSHSTSLEFSSGEEERNEN